LVLACAGVLFGPVAAGEAPRPLGPGWHNVRGDQATLSQSAAQARARAAANPLPPRSGARSAVEYAPEVTELARGLRHDPLLIFNYVRNHIDYSVYYGHRKAPVLTLLDEAGNDFDQAALLVALLRCSGYSATFAFGYMRYARSQAANWIGALPIDSRITEDLRYAGVPYSRSRHFADCVRPR
jgi:transglutaminase-like putative cysteine protease